MRAGRGEVPAAWQPRRLRSRAVRIAAAYALFATLWIFFSDRVLGWLVPDPKLLVEWSVLKGLGFVALTAVLLFLLIRRTFGALERGYVLLQEQQVQIERLGRLRTVLGQLNQTIARVPDRNELFRRGCELLVQEGGFRMVWIGWRNPATEQLEPVAWAGDGSDYLQQLRVYADERPEGQGPSGRAYRANHPFVCNDFAADPVAVKWREEALRRGFRASIALPIRNGDGVGGVLNVYAAEKNFFGERERGLLVEAAADLGFALDLQAQAEARRVAETRAESERRFSDTMIDSMPGVLYFYDVDGRFLRWNRNFEKVTGWTGAEIAGMTPLDFFRPEDRPAVEQRIAEVFAEGESAVEAPFRAKDGSTVPYFFTGRRVEMDGRVCLVGVGIDVSERILAETALRETQERLQIVADNLREGLVIAEPETGFARWNPAALRLLGFDESAENYRRRGDFNRLFELATPDGVPLPAERWPLARVYGGETLDAVELRVRRTDREWEREISYSGSHVRYADGKTLAFLTLRDVTRRRRAERELRVANETLEKTVQARTAELRTALVRAEAADRIKSAFLATMSHELRTPLNSIIGFTGIVLQGLAGPLNPEQTKQLGMVRGSARHLLELINDVLDLSKIEAGQLAVRAEPFALRETAERAVASVRPLAERKGLALTADLAEAPERMTGDRRRVEQVLLNLLNNAIKFTERGGVTLRIGPARDAAGAEIPDAVRLVVTDTGIGIKSADVETIFQPFRQIDSGLSRLHEGTGLGLAICRRLAELMGGTIGVRSEWGKGSEFAVVLPRERKGVP